MFQSKEDKLRQKHKNKLNEIEVDKRNKRFFVHKDFTEEELAYQEKDPIDQEFKNLFLLIQAKE